MNNDGDCGLLTTYCRLLTFDVNGQGHIIPDIR